MRKTLYLHVGTPKTGTSTIQWFLYRNREVLAQQGILYPALSDKTPGHHYIANNYRTQPLSWVEPIPRGKVLRKIARAMEAMPEAHSLCLSSEAFWGCRKRLNKFRQDFADYDIKVIVLLRRQDDFMNALYRQDVKARKRVGDAVTFVRNGLKRLDYREKLTLLEGIFGRENFTIIPFEPATWHDGLENVVLNIMNIKSTEGFRILGQRNISLCNAAIRYVQDVMDIEAMDQETYAATIRALGIYSQKIYDTLGKDHIMAPEERTAFLETYREQNAEIASRYIGAERSSLFQLPYKPHTNLRSLEEPLSRQEMKDISKVLKQEV